MKPQRAIVATAALWAGVNAFFRTTCAPIKRERIDSLISPNQESSHMHTFFGNVGVAAQRQDNADLQQYCTSCDNQNDKSAYWMPTLYYGMYTKKKKRGGEGIC